MEVFHSSQMELNYTGTYVKQFVKLKIEMKTGIELRRILSLESRKCVILPDTQPHCPIIGLWSGNYNFIEIGLT